MKKLYILKIGGSVVTHKNKATMVIRRTLLQNIALDLKKFLQKNTDIQIILVHGGGQPGHSIAKKYHLDQGISKDKKNLKGALLCSAAIQKLHQEICTIFVNAGLWIAPIHTASVIVQKQKKIQTFDTEAIIQGLQNGAIPLLYGDMVHDTSTTFSVCSSDTLAAHLSKHLGAQKIFFATDVDGIFTADPYLDPKAVLIPKISLGNKLSQNIKLSKSHNTDVTGGLHGKVASFEKIFQESEVKEVIIFNGLKKDRYLLALANTLTSCTRIGEARADRKK